jgi:hypothetical protein
MPKMYQMIELGDCFAVVRGEISVRYGPLGSTSSMFIVHYNVQNLGHMICCSRL